MKRPVLRDYTTRWFGYLYKPRTKSPADELIELLDNKSLDQDDDLRLSRLDDLCDEIQPEQIADILKSLKSKDSKLLVCSNLINKFGFRNKYLTRSLLSSVDDLDDIKRIADLIQRGKLEHLSNTKIAGFNKVLDQTREYLKKLNLEEKSAVRLPGTTLIVIDVSGSMECYLGKSSQYASMIASRAESTVVYATAGSDYTRVHKTEEIGIKPGHRNFYGELDSNRVSLGGGGIFLVQCMNYIFKINPKRFDRTMVITDERDCDLKHRASLARKIGYQNYIVNVCGGSGECDAQMVERGWTRTSRLSHNIITEIAYKEAGEREKLFVR